MAAFSYKAMTKDGRRVDGTVQADDRRGALAAVRKLGHTPLSVSEAGGGGAVARKTATTKKKSGGGILDMKFGGKSDAMTEMEVLLFTSELADLLEAGMTLGQALGCLANQGEEGSAQRTVAQDLCARIVNGEAFSDAVAHHPKTFRPLYANMIRAGEASGAMVGVLHRLVEHYERFDSMKAKIKGAMMYPAFVLVFGVGAVILAMGFIIPRFKKVFDSLGGSLPTPTAVLLSMSDFMLEYGWLMALIIAAAVVWFSKWKQTPAGRAKVDGWKLKMPLVKGIVAAGAYSSLAFTLQTLLTNGVNVLQALKIAEDTCDNAVIGQALSVARKRVTDGTTISGPLAASGAFPRMMTDMLAVGEQAGNMASSLGHIGMRYQKDMDRNIAKFTNALGPLLIGVISVGVGFIAYAIVSAVFAVSNSLG
ncbi:MAG: type II secretion system F family protein [Kiritimatiellae bacterium]|nr:type II secretion system F family protein [Kiritimatiellia bacterium]